MAKIWIEACISWDENLNMAPNLAELYSKYYSADWNWSTLNLGRMLSTERENNMLISLMPYIKMD